MMASRGVSGGGRVEPNQNTHSETVIPNLEDLLNRSGIDLHLKNAITLLLQNRPQDPIHFLAEYFKSLKDDDESSIMKAYKIIIQNPIPRKNIDENLYKAYKAILNKKPADSSLRGHDMIALIQMLFINFPISTTNKIIRMTAKTKEDLVNFEEFMAGMKISLHFLNYFEELARIFNYLDTGSEKVTKKEIVEACEILEGKEVALPNMDMLYDMVYQREFGGNEYMTYEQFLHMFMKLSLK